MYYDPRIEPMLLCHEGKPGSTKEGRFHALPTASVVSVLARNGYETTLARGPWRKAPSMHSKHLVRMRQLGAPTSVGDTVPEIVIVNANDGTSSLRILAGLFRYVCSNGLIINTATVGAISLRHSSPRILEQSLLDAVSDLGNRAKQVLPVIDTWRGITMSKDRAEAFAGEAMKLRLAEDTPIRPYQLLQARRTEDTGHDLWTVFNTVQENLLRKGISAYRRNDNGTTRRVSIRDVNNVSQNVSFNTKLWELAERYAVAA